MKDDVRGRMRLNLRATTTTMTLALQKLMTNKHILMHLPYKPSGEAGPTTMDNNGKA